MSYYNQITPFPMAWGGRRPETSAAPKLKKIVRINQASIAAHPGSNGKPLLFGIPENHAAPYLNGKPIRTSPILKIEGNRVETQNTVYDVRTWQIQEYEFSAN